MAAEVGLFVSAEDVLVFARGLVEGEEVGQGHRDAFEQLFQGAEDERSSSKNSRNSMSENFVGKHFMWRGSLLPLGCEAAPKPDGPFC